jgi:CHAT domain-containing protein
MEEAIKKLGRKQTAINFFWGEANIFVIHFSDSASQFLRIPNSELFQNNLKLIVENIANPQWAEEEANKEDVKQEFINACRYMYQKIMGELDLQKDKHLIIIPDGQLFYLPFEVLIDQENYAELNYGDYNYLLKKHPLRYDFSLNAALENTGTKNNKKGLIAFAPSYKNSNRKVLNKEMNFYPLKNAEHEVHWLDQVLGAEAHFEENAQENTFKSKNNYSVEHLAMHGFLNQKDDLFSGLVFAEPTDQEDGILYAYEIYDMDLNCDLVCLSACNTGIGKLQKGEGVLSLGRAFKHAGSASICMSLWVSEDEQNRTLMQNFYKGLRDKLPKDVALQKAKLSLLKNDSKQFPHFWAAYILMGSNEPISFNQGYANYFWGGIILLTLILGIVYIFRARFFGGSINSKNL